MLETPHVHPDPARPLVCPYCHARFADHEKRWACPRCGTEHHDDCARENGRCTVMGCEAIVLGAVPRPPRAPGAPLDLDAVVREAALRHQREEERRRELEPTPAQKKKAARAARRRARRRARDLREELASPTFEEAPPTVAPSLLARLALAVFFFLLALVAAVILQAAGHR